LAALFSDRDPVPALVDRWQRGAAFPGGGERVLVAGEAGGWGWSGDASAADGAAVGVDGGSAGEDEFQAVGMSATRVASLYIPGRRAQFGVGVVPVPVQASKEVPVLVALLGCRWRAGREDVENAVERVPPPQISPH
jgi:hypothetical protein